MHQLVYREVYGRTLYTRKTWQMHNKGPIIQAGKALTPSKSQGVKIKTHTYVPVPQLEDLILRGIL